MNPQNDKALNKGVSRRGFLAGGVVAGAVAGGSMGAFYYGYKKTHPAPLRVGVLGTGDEGSVLLGAINPDCIEVRSIADIRPFNVWRAFHGDYSSPVAMEVRPGLMKKYKWQTEDEARRHVKVYRNGYQELIDNAKNDGIEAVIIALPLHLHAPAAIAAMQAGLHVMTEKLMGHTVHECKEMARIAKNTNRILATGHQRHYNILYANAMDLIQRGSLGELHYIRAQWYRGNLPGKDSWQQPMPKAAKPDDKQSEVLLKRLAAAQKDLANARGADIDLCLKRMEQCEAQIADTVDAARFGYENRELKDAAGKVIYNRPAVEELIRWRLWDRTGAGLMAELGSHQLDAASIFISAMHGGEKQMPLNVAAAGNRPLFPADRDVEDHVYCIIEFPAPGYDPKDPVAKRKKIGVQYASINGNGFGGYGEIVYGTEGTLILEREQEMSVVKKPGASSSVKVSGGAALDTQASGAVGAVAKSAGPTKVSRGYTEELEHWAWCIQHPASENQPRCGPKVAMGDAIIALTTNMAARRGERIEFKKEWFDVDNDATPEGVKPDISRYKNA